MKEKIMKIIQDNRPDLEICETTDFIGDALLDSFDIVTLVAEFDKAFNISIDGDDITPDNFRTVSDIENLILKNGAK